MGYFNVVFLPLNRNFIFCATLFLPRFWVVLLLSFGVKIILKITAYQIEADRYNNYNIPPLTQTITEIKEEFKTHIFLKAISGDKIIGTVRAKEKNETCYVGRLAVLPDLQNQGIGTALMKEIEKYFTSRRFELFVGSKSDNNIHLYQKLGYNIFKTGSYECGDIEILYMEKNR